jgi:hypothetical protein
MRSLSFLLIFRVMRWHAWCSILILLFLPTCSLTGVLLQAQAHSGKPDSAIDTFKATAAQLASASPDSCSMAAGRFQPENATGLEDKLFEMTDAAVLKALHTDSSDQGRAAAVRRTLEAFRAASAEVNKAWPEERRFHYKLLAIYPVLVVQFGLRSRTTYSVFGVPELKPTGPRRPNHDWLQIALDPLRWSVRKGNEELEISSLYEGPARRARFLAHYTFEGCGDVPRGIAYKGYEWEPAWTGKMRLILDREGTLSGALYPTIGEMHISGKRITLPYCWWSAVDESVWASLCSVDEYDFSDDLVKFLGTQTNRPDLEAVARAIEYGERRDVSALLGYAIDARAANEIAENMPAYVYPDVVTVTQISDVRETITLGDGPVLHFTLIKRGDQWLIESLVVNTG